LGKAKGMGGSIPDWKGGSNSQQAPCSAKTKTGKSYEETAWGKKQTKKKKIAGQRALLTVKREPRVETLPSSTQLENAREQKRKMLASRKQ